MFDTFITIESTGGHEWMGHMPLIPVGTRFRHRGTIYTTRESFVDLSEGHDEATVATQYVTVSPR